MSDETKPDSASRPPQPSSPQLNDAADVRQPRAGNRGGCSTVGDSPRRDDEQRESPTVSESLPSRLSAREFWEQRVVNLEPVFIPRSESAFAFAEAYAASLLAERDRELAQEARGIVANSPTHPMVKSGEWGKIMTEARAATEGES